MHILELILFPIIWVMQWLLDLYISILSSTGIAILLLSFTFALLLLPVQKIAQRAENRVRKKMSAVEKEVDVLKKSGLKGEKLFFATEEIYKNHAYHPIQGIGIGAGFLAMLPVLISAIILLTGSDALNGKSFLFISDLSEPDGLLGPINVLPLLMSSITLIDARLRFKDDKKSQYRFAVIALVLLVLVYALPSGLVLYWTGSNIMSLLLSRLQP